MKRSTSSKQTTKLPDYAGKLGMSDMAGIGSDETAGDLIQ